MDPTQDDISAADPPVSIPNVKDGALSISTTAFPPEPILKLSKCDIRIMHPYDAQSMTHHASNPNVARYMSGVFNDYSLQKAYGWILTNLTAPIQSHFAIAVPLSPGESSDDGIPAINATHSFIGGIGLRLGGDVTSRTAEMGYWLAEDHWGQGIISEALPAFTDWCWHAYPDLVRIWAHVVESNAASSKALERAGYVKEGIMKYAYFKHGKLHNGVQWAMCRDEWEERNRKAAASL